MQIAPRDAATRQFLAMTLREVGRPRDAIPHLQEALRLDPDDAANLQAYRLALRADPARVEVLLDLDASRRRLGRPEEADAVTARGMAGAA